MLDIIIAVLVILLLLGLWVRDEVKKKVKKRLRALNLDLSGIRDRNLKVRMKREQRLNRVGGRFKKLHSITMIILACVSLFCLIFARTWLFYSFITLALWTGLVPRIAVRIKKRMIR